MVREMGIPTISTTYQLGYGIPKWRNLDDVEKQYLIHVNSPGDTIPVMIKDIVNYYNIKTLVIYYDNSFKLDHKQKSLLFNTKTRFIIRQLEGTTVETYVKMLADMNKAKLNNYFIFGTIDTLNKIIEAANENEMIEKPNKWHFITKEKGKLECKTCKRIEVMFSQPLKSRLHDYELNITLDNIDNINKVDSYFYHDLTRFTLEIIDDRIHEWPQNITFPKCGKHLDKELKQERVSFQFANELAQEVLYGMFGRFVFNSYKMQNNYQEISMRTNKVVISGETNNKNTKISEWEYEGHTGTLIFTAAQEKQENKLKHYKIVTIIQAPFVMKTSVNDTKNEDFYGYCIDLLKEILNHTKEEDKFTYELYVVDKFGTKDESKKWSGMIGELAEKRADIALGPISVMAERETVVDFTVPYYDLVGITILMRKPSVPSHLFKFLTVLETNVWLCILAAYFFTSFLMYLFDRLSPYSYHNNKEKYKDDDEKREFTLKECLWFCMTSLTPQGGGEAPRNLSGRLVAATWWLFGFIIIASYTANLAAFLTVSRLDSPIDSLDDLAKQYKIKYAPQEGTSSATYFERMAGIEEKFYEIWKDMSLNDSLSEEERAKLAVWDYPVSDKYTKIWAQIQEAKPPASWMAGVERVKQEGSTKPNEGFAFIAEATMVKYAVMTNCDLQSVGNEFSRKPLALAVQQASPLKDQLSSAILKLLNQRRLESLKEIWWNKNKEKKDCQDSKKQSDGISINNIGGVFIVIFIGVVLACITLAVEYWYFKGKRDGAKVVAIKEYGNTVRNAHNGTAPIGHMGHGIPAIPAMGPMSIRH
ncbi:ionotropic receptor 25a-like [Oppia nitens]|uniref:ionotropic receptor 25a-like n=1 Tax=Oppia nitens TaxID=1686743 RepID=UPI0023D9F3FD|nr:ionotropic receptor 25a-like [Oppia nitens]